jgi:hypothetical protein
VSLEALYLIDAVGLAPSSSPNSFFALSVLTSQGRVPTDNPEQINGAVKSVGLFYQRNQWPFGINVTYGAPWAFAPFRALTASHGEIDELGHPDGRYVHSQVLAHATSVLNR